MWVIVSVLFAAAVIWLGWLARHWYRQLEPVRAAAAAATPPAEDHAPA